MGAEKVTVTIATTFNDNTSFLSAGASTKIAELIELARGDLGVTNQVLAFTYNGSDVDPNATLASFGATDLFFMAQLQQAAAAPQGIDPMMQQLQQLQQQIVNDPQLIDQLSRNNPALLQAALESNWTEMKRIVEEINRFRQQQQAQEPPPIVGDPMDPAVQAQMYQRIQETNIKENFEEAIEHNPEAFGKVPMLYINCEVNSVPMKAFVDSGAQSTIISEECARKCNLLRLMDTRFAGMAQGVGTARILGRVHMAPLKIGGTFFTSSFTVLQSQPGAQELEFLLGLDNLKRHQACIDLRENVLKIGDVAVAFLPEHEIPGHDELQREMLRGSSSGIPQSPQSQQQSAAPQASSASVGAGAGAGAGAEGAPQPGSSEEVIQQLMSVTGADRNSVIQALRQAGGNPDAAAQSLAFGF